ncbi:hypothetical protein GJ744_002833 [Endocarpon pusillum]|uniref:AMP-activated protein kinase glycogen-binding domain-containing protein n=1 Tax=Endocarpon pusillum TaxID=364733 RepID=A0A8H7A8G7_9EURO|nr:hypothetical protein GJ744_002833 [Endocarpon pusillum]
MASTVITLTYRKLGTIPPVFVAGSFSEPPWEAQELSQDAEEGSGSFSRTFSITPGTYQYKFRLGTGDWWVTDETQETVTDDQGNVNNLLLVQDTQEVSPHADVSGDQQKMSMEDVEEAADPSNMLPKAGEPESPPAIPVSDFSVQAVDGPAASLPQTTSAPITKVSSTSNVSHDLPTPPLSEGGDDVENKEPLAASSKVIALESEDQSQASRRSTDERASNMPSSTWNGNRMIFLAIAFAAVPIVAWGLSR